MWDGRVYRAHGDGFVDLGVAGLRLSHRSPAALACGTLFVVSDDAVFEVREGVARPAAPALDNVIEVHQAPGNALLILRGLNEDQEAAAILWPDRRLTRLSHSWLETSMQEAWWLHAVGDFLWVGRDAKARRMPWSWVASLPRVAQ